MSRGKFLVFEGIDGSGKSTQVRLLASRLVKDGMRVHVTQEPTYSPIGTLIRNAMNGRTPLDDRVIGSLFVADRLDHLVNQVDGVLKLLDEGWWVISDRYYLSSYAYHAKSLGLDWVSAANRVSSDQLQPDLTFYLRVDPEVGAHRVSRGRAVTEKYERLDRLRDVASAYEVALEDYTRAALTVVLDGLRPSQEISLDVWRAVRTLSADSSRP